MTLNIAHRGASARAPENTLEAFTLALADGADALEFDVQQSRDGELVVVHDRTVDRTTDGTGEVAALTASELAALDAGFRFADADGAYPFRGAGLRMPTLAQVFQAFPATPMVVELKPYARAGVAVALAELVRDRGRTRDVIVASFSTAYLRRVRDLLPRVRTNLGSREVRILWFLHRVGLHWAWQPEGDVIQVPEHHGRVPVLTPRLARAARQRGLDVHVWTVNETDDMRRMIDLGVDGIITDRPDRLAGVLAELRRREGQFSAGSSGKFA